MVICHMFPTGYILSYLKKIILVDILFGLVCDSNCSKATNIDSKDCSILSSFSSLDVCDILYKPHGASRKKIPIIAQLK